MEPREYDRLRSFEGWYWWYVAQRANLTRELKTLPLPDGARILDAGCGTGRALREVVKAFPMTGYGIDVSPHAAAAWNGDAGVFRSRASVNALPCASGAFDAVYSIDVIGCKEVRIPTALAEMVRVLKPAGFLVLLVPAYQWMLSSHDAAVHSVHRFGRRELREVVTAAGARVLRCTHRFPLFFPWMAVSRWLRRRRTGHEGVCPGSDLRPIPGWLNRSLLAAARWEHTLIQRINVPFGSTILLTAQKAD